MKILIFSFLFAIILFGQENKIIKYGKSCVIMHVGKINRDVFQENSYNKWYNREYNNYLVDTTTVKLHKDIINDKKIEIILGTWCSDSRREVPRLLKILDFIKFPEESLNIICIDREMRGIKNEVDDKNIKYVPTIIFYNNNEEIGRIIEVPKISLEKDIVEILN